MENKQDKLSLFQLIKNDEYSSKDKIDINNIAMQVATKANTILLNTTVKELNNNIDSLKSTIGELVNEFRKQSVDDRNSSFKMARRNQTNAIPIKSIDSHITHIVSLIHIAQLYKLRTNKGDKFSSQKARQLLIDLDLLENPNFVSKNIQGSCNIVKKYHFDIMYEIESRLKNPDDYNLNIELCLEWREKCFMPSEMEIQQFIDEISSLLEVSTENEI